ncbi:MAG TPA: hypothetical protein PK369_00160 [Thermoclostridium sp.]|nr:hypothetical protein [Clostridiaceae bacterium]HOQ74962.1 hypothetical protein [Thermoclostridium sp.]HPU45523.1 hypothetical protein [Thermoclostridium sp.]
MDNKISSIIKRSLRVTSGYITAFLIMCALSASVFGLARENTPQAMPWLSFATFLVLFFAVYNEMRSLAVKESRPQYNINPSKFKGLLYGALGVIPILLVQLIIIAIRVTEPYAVFRRRIFQLVSGPLYWLARILGNEIWHYFLAVASIIIIAFLGYFAGHKKFYITAWLRETLGTKKSKKA